jgi:hypothetical protein
MKTAAIIVAGVAVALAATAAAASSVPKGDLAKGEARLARMIAGRTPGKPESCINTNRSDKLEVIPGVAVVYDGGKTVWVARPKDPQMLGRNDAIVMDRFSAVRLCVQEAMRTVDRYDHYHTGVVFLEDFVPYTKAN